MLILVNGAYTGTKNLYNIHIPYRGAVAQLGERFNGILTRGNSSFRLLTLRAYPDTDF